MTAEADDAALLTQGKEDNESRRKIDRKDEQDFKLSGYNAAKRKKPCKGVLVFEWFYYILKKTIAGGGNVP